RIGRKRAGHQFELVVDAGGDAVHSADEGALAAADHAEPDAAALRLLFATLDRHGQLLSRPSILRFAASSVPAPAKSSKACSVTRMIWCLMNSAPSRA